MAKPKEAGIASASIEGTITYGSGNVFADLDLPNPEEQLAKAKLAGTIHDLIRARGLTQKKAAELMGIDQPKVSKIVRGRLSEFSIEWLIARIRQMGANVEIVVRTDRADTNKEGTISVACV